MFTTLHTALDTVGAVLPAFTITQVFLVSFLTLLAVAVYNYAGPPLYAKTKVFKEMNVKIIPPLRSRMQSEGALIRGHRHAMSIDAEQIAKHGKVFAKIDALGPTLMVADPELLRDIFVKDFGHFYNRREAQGGFFKLFVESLFFQRDQRWHDIRSLVSPTFSSAKMRQMDGLIRDCLKITQTELEERFEKKGATDDSIVEIDAKNYFSNFAMDVIGTVFFGVGVDAIRQRDHPFVKHSFSVFKPPKGWRVLLFVAAATKYLRGLLMKYGFFGLPLEARHYFQDVITQMIRDRRDAINNNIHRRDFLNVLITARAGTAQSNQELTATGALKDDNADDQHVNAGATDKGDVSTKKASSPSDAGGRIFQKASASKQLTDDEIAGQIFIFMIAGFETTATTIGFLCHELALNQDVQDRLRDEVNTVLGDSKQLSYDTIAEMPFLDACATETLRLYPPVTRLERQCAEDVTLSNGLLIKKGVIVGIPAWYIQHSPENFVDPEKFDPDRFFDEERRAQIKPYTYLPFGQGPRNCVGMRFALLELKMVTAFVIRNYRIVPTAKTVHPVPLQTNGGGLLRPKLGTFVGLERIKNLE